MKILIYLIFAVYCLSGCKNFAAGSYPYAEKYRFKINADTLIGLLSSLKEKDSTLVPPVQLHLVDGKKDSLDYWYNFYFLNQSKSEIFFTWVRAENNEITDIAFVSVSEGLRLGHWKDINKDYNETENDIKKEEFKNLILSRINNKPIR